jgi:pimeloyl-ACP methyl ester carboxylesterase
VTPARQIWKYVRRIWIAAGITATAVFVIWSLIAYRPSAEARQASIGDGAVAVTYSEGVWELRAATRKARQTALMFFPGALVDPRAYAPLVRAVAAAGYPAFIVELPRRGAFGGANAPEVHARFQAARRHLSGSAQVVLGGHSRGAVVASGLASRRLPGLAGLILIGTSHPRDVDLSDLRVPVVKIAGTRDGLASAEGVKQNASKLPAGTRWVWVEGGNHSQFGWYGFQPGDWWATVDASEQRRMMIDAVLVLLNDIETTRPRP